MIEDLNYSDFNDLYVIALGLSMAYIVVRGKEEDGFYTVLSNITNFVKNYLLGVLTKSSQEEEEIVTKIKVYLSYDKLNSQSTVHDLSQARDMANDVMRKVNCQNKWIKTKQTFHTTTDFLYVISYDCFLLALFTECAVPFKDIFPNFVNKLLFVSLLVVCMLLLHCIISEHIEFEGRRKRVKPSMFLHSLLLIVPEILLCVLLPDSFIPCIYYVAIWLVVGCFSGFIVYFVAIFLINLFLLFKSVIKILSFRIAKSVKEQKRLIAIHQNEFQDVDLQMEENINDIMLEPENAETNQ